MFPEIPGRTADTSVLAGSGCLQEDLARSIPPDIISSSQAPCSKTIRDPSPAGTFLQMHQAKSNPDDSKLFETHTD